MGCSNINMLQTVHKPENKCVKPENEEVPDANKLGRL